MTTSSEFADATEQLSFFFDPPEESPDNHAKSAMHSTLYLLRRELLETMGYDPNRESENTARMNGSRHRLFASLILMFTVCDLLAKFMCGDDGGVGERFKRFLTSPTGGGQPPPEADLLWAIRNSLVHSFGVPPGEKLASLNLTSVGIAQRKDTEVSGSAATVITSRNENVGVAYVDGIYGMTLDAIRRYEETLYGEGRDEPRVRFSAMFAKYGVIKMARYL
jgi:hypothetical protein